MRNHLNSVAARFVGVLAVVFGFSLELGAWDCPVSCYKQDGLIACWDGYDNQADGTHHATGSVWRDTVAGYEFSLSNVTIGDRYLGFNGSTSYGELTAAAGAAVAFPSGVKTVEIVIKLETTSGIALHGPSTSGVSFGPYSGYILNNNKDRTTGYSDPGTTVTNVYATVYGSNDLPSVLNCNGAAATPAGANNYWGSADTSAWIGKRSSGNQFTGKIFAIRVYNRELSADDIAHNYGVDCYRFFDDDSRFTPEVFAVDPIADQSFAASEIRPAVSVRSDATGEMRELTLGTDYTVAYSNNFALGVATARVTGCGTYAGKKTASTFNIVPPADSAIRLEGDFTRQVISAARPVTIPNLAVTDASENPLDPAAYTLLMTNHTVTGTATVWVKVTSGPLANAVAARTLDLAILPAEYQRVEYIRGTGTQYVDTQYKPGAQTTLVMDYNVGNYVYNSTVFSTGNGWTLFMNGQYKYSTPEVSTGFGMWGANAVLTIKPGSDNFIIEAGGSRTVKTVSLTNNSGTLYIFGGCSLNKGQHAVRKLELSENGVAKREFYPVVRLADGKTGLYDVLNGVFSPNLGTGAEFAVGRAVGGTFNVSCVTNWTYQLGQSFPAPVVKDPTSGATLVEGTDYEVAYEDCDGPGRGMVYVSGLGNYRGGVRTEVTIDTRGVLPPGYTALEYIESTGTQWLGTEYFSSKSYAWSYRLDAAMTRDDGYSGILGGFFIQASGGYGADGTRRLSRLDVTTNGTGTVYIDRQRAQSVTVTGQSGQCIVLLAPMKSNSNVIDGGYKKMSARVYGFALYRDGVLVSRCVPARRDGDGALGLYDFVWKRLRTNYGTGTFVAGPDAAQPRLTALPIPEQTTRNHAAVTPSVQLVDATTGATNTATTADFAFTYRNNCSNGLAQVILTGKPDGAYAGETAVAYFPVRVNADSIPRTYQQVDCLKSVGTQRLNTGFYPSTDTDILFEYDIEQNANNASLFSGGSWYVLHTSGAWYWYPGTISFGSAAVNGDYHIRVLPQTTDNVTMTRNGTSTTKTCSTANIASGGTFQTTFNQTYKCSMKKIVFREGGVLKGEFYPVSRVADGVLGFYDIVTESFCTNTAGGADFRFNEFVNSDIFVDDIQAQIYEGGAVTPDPAVYDSATGRRLTKDVDYTVTYTNNTAAGTARVFVRGKGAYSGQLFKDFRITPPIFASAEGAADNTGESWDSPLTVAAAVTKGIAAYNAGSAGIIWIKSGTVSGLATQSITVPLKLVGGFKGASGTSAEVDTANPYTVFDVNLSSGIKDQFTDTANVDGYKVELERLEFRRAYQHGYQKTSGISGLVFRDCRFVANACYNASLEGRGLKAVGQKRADLVLTNCVFAGNGNFDISQSGAGFALHVKGFRRTVLDDCHFVTNGICCSNGRGGGDCVVYVTDSPVLCRNTTYRGSIMAASGRGAGFYLTGNCAGSAFTNCLFAGHSAFYGGTYNPASICGAVALNLADNTHAVDFDHCTFAYNMNGAIHYNNNYGGWGGYVASAGLYVHKGAVKVRNTIFWGNTISSDNSASADFYIRNGSADIDHTILGGLDRDYLNGVPGGGATISVGEHVFSADPHFVTELSDLASCFSGTLATPRSTLDRMKHRWKSDAASLALLAAIDCRFDPAYANSTPAYYYGCYGHAADEVPASHGTPALAADDVAVTFPDGLTAPRVAFTLGGTGMFNAEVAVKVATNDVTLVESAFAGLTNGMDFAWTANCCPKADAALTITVTVKSPGCADIVLAKSETATGAQPPWTGHGGDPAKVVHVRVGSTAVNPQGTSWEDAYPDFRYAMGIAGGARDEVWIAGDYAYEKAPVYVVNCGEITLRGGFDGTEDAAEDRANGTYTTLDGQRLCVPFRLQSATAIAFERIRFTRGNSRGFYREESVGAVTFRDCCFDDNVCVNSSSDYSGCGFYSAQGGKGLHGDIAFYGTRFEGNGRGAVASAKTVYGGAIYIKNETSLTVDGCTFVTNGCSFGVVNNVTTSSPITGAAIYDEGTPFVISNSKFIGNRSSCLTTSTIGGTVYLTSAITGGSIANCAFIGNETVQRSNKIADAGTMTGTVIVNYTESVRTFDVKNCTFAWNLTSANACPVDLFINSGTATLRNSIFHGGVTGSANAGASGAAKYVKTGGSGSVETTYTMFDGTPLFVTDDPGVAVVDGETVWARYEDAAAKFLAADVHLLSPRGYYDNAGTLHENTEVAYSKAIDAGDPNDSVGDEPQPNGDFINLGVYGGTAEASMTKEVLPVIVDDQVTVTFPDNTTLPQVDFDLASGEEYIASVRVYTGTNGVYSAQSPVLPIGPGQHFTWRSSIEPYRAGDTVNVKVVITCGTKSVTKEVTATAQGEMPGWFGTGGGPGVLHVWADAPGDRSGKDWRNAYATLAEALAAYNGDVKAIWVTGDETLTNSYALTALAPVSVIGGFSACENAVTERVPGKRSFLHGGMTYNTMTLVNAADRPVTLDSFDYCMAINHGVHKTGAGDLNVFNCTFLTNATMSRVSPYNGRGLYVSATGAKVVVSNCVFAGNRLQTSVNPGTGSYDSTLGQGSGSAAYFTGCKSVEVFDSDFLWNGNPYIEANKGQSSGNPQCGGFSGSAIYANVPTTIRGCSFRGNSETVRETAGGTVRLEGTATGVVERCLFAGNFGRYMSESSGAGALVINLASAAYKVDVNRCTFACNLADARKASAGLTVMVGDVELANSVFTGNMLGKIALDTGADLNVQAGSSCRISYTVFANTNEVESVSVAAGATCTMGAGVVRGDPLIVTEGFTLTNTAYFAWNSSKYPYYRDDAATYAAAGSIDAHVRSSAGYYDNSGNFLKAAEGVLSPAIDAGDPLVPCTEPGENGGRMNAGFYGNTAEASQSPYGDPRLEDDPMLTFPDTYSIPTVLFTVGGEGTFSAEATIYLMTNGVDWIQIGNPLTGLKLGQTVQQQLPIYLVPGATVKVRVDLSGAGKQHEYASAETTVTKPGPHWWGKGGDAAKIIHCRPGAIASKEDGTSWTDAVTDIASALALMTAEKNEIWICGTNLMSGALAKQTIAFPFVVRGGFTARENAAAERPSDGEAAIDAGLKYDAFTLENASEVLFERVAFLRSNEHNFTKTGAGDVTFDRCRFAHSRSVGSYNGRGGHFTGTTATTLTFRNCVVEGNNPTGFSGNYSGVGMGFYITTFKRVFIDDTLFVTNGSVIGGASANNQSWGPGGGIYATAAPLTVRGSRFVGTSRGSENSSGGVIYLDTGCGGSAFTNCLFAGNEDFNQGTYGPPSSVGALTVAMGAAADHVDVVNCTFAHNISDGTVSAGGVRIVKGSVDIVNSIFYDMIVGKNHQDGGRAVYASGADTSVRIRYSICETNVDFMSDGTASLTIGEGVLYADPMLVTDRDYFKPLYVDSGSGNGARRRFRATSTAAILKANMHLKSRAGYVDEETGTIVRFRGASSPALDAGDPAMSYEHECARNQVGSNGKRINMGFYGNTSSSTMTPIRGALLRVR